MRYKNNEFSKKLKKNKNYKKRGVKGNTSLLFYKKLSGLKIIIVYYSFSFLFSIFWQIEKYLDKKKFARKFQDSFEMNFSLNGTGLRYFSEEMRKL